MCISSPFFGVKKSLVLDTVQTVSAMKAASVDLKKGMKEIQISEVEDLHDDMADLLEDADEINEVCSIFPPFDRCC